MVFAEKLRDILRNGVAHKCACVKLSARGGGAYRSTLG